jgi:hypothetical protein
MEPAEVRRPALEMVCLDCGGLKWLKVRGEYTASCKRCGSRSMRIRPVEEVDEMALKKFGVGEVTDIEKTDTAKTASKQEWTEDDNKELARENDDEED